MPAGSRKLMMKTLLICCYATIAPATTRTRHSLKFVNPLARKKQILVMNGTA